MCALEARSSPPRCRTAPRCAPNSASAPGRPAAEQNVVVAIHFDPRLESSIGSWTSDASPGRSRAALTRAIVRRQCSPARSGSGRIAGVTPPCPASCSTPRSPRPPLVLAPAPTSPTPSAGTSRHLPAVEAWEEAYDDLDGGVQAYGARKGTLASGAAALLDALQASDTHGPARLQGLLLRLAHATTRISATTHERRRRSRCSMLLAQWRQATSWFNPELLALPLETLRGWMDADSRARALSLHDRGPVSASRNTCSTNRASTCCRWPRSSATRPTTPTRRCRPPTCSFRRSS